MAKGFFFLSLLLSLALLINARVPTLLPEKPQEDAQDSLVNIEPKLLLPSEKQESESEPVTLPAEPLTLPAEPLTLRGPIPTEEDDLFAGNRHHVHHVYIRRPFLFRFPRRFHHHKHEHEHEHEHEDEHEHEHHHHHDDHDHDDDHEDDHEDDHDDDRYKHHHHEHFMGGGLHFFPEKEGEIEFPIRGAEFEGRFLDENHLPDWFRGHDQPHHHDHHHRFFPDGFKEMKRRHKHKHEEEDDDDKPRKGGVLKWFSNLLNMP